MQKALPFPRGLIKSKVFYPYTNARETNVINNDNEDIKATLLPNIDFVPMLFIIKCKQHFGISK